MSDDKQDKHDQALDLTDAALEALDTGDDAKADKLINQAKRLDPAAVQEVVKDLEEAEGASGDFEDANADEDEFDEEDEEAAG